jgi:iron(III) transport system permease protein
VITGQRWALTGITLAVPLALVGFPLATLVATATSVPTAELVRVLERIDLPTLFAHVALLGTLATGWALTAAVPLAWLVSRTDLPGRAVVRGVAPLALAVPPYVLALAYIVLLSPGGSAHRAAAASLDVALASLRWPGFIFGTGGAAFVLGLSGAPSVFLLVHGALDRVNPSLEDAARGLGIGPERVFIRVTLPLLRGPLVAGSLLVFLYACVDFGVVSLLRARTVTTVLFTYLSTGFAPHASAAIALLLVGLLWIVLAAQDRAGRLGVGGATGRQGDAGISALADQRAQRDARPVSLGRLRPLAIIYVVIVTGLGIVVPVLTLASLSLSLGPTALGAFWGTQGEYLVHTFQIGATTATIATGGGLALALARGRGRVTTLVIGLCQIGYALPGTVLALAVVGLVPKWVPWIDGTTGEIVLAVAILTFAPAFQSCATALDTVPRGLVDAARSLGETSIGAFRRVTLPMAGPAILSAWSLAFGLAARELAATLIVRPPGYDTLAVRLWVHTTDVGPDPRAAAVAMLLLTVLGATWGVALWLGRRAHAVA